MIQDNKHDIIHLHCLPEENLTARSPDQVVAAARRVTEVADEAGIDTLPKQLCEAIGALGETVTEYDNAPLTLVQALARCLELAKTGQAYGARPIGHKGIVYGWEGLANGRWILRYVVADTETGDDTFNLGGFEVISQEVIGREWPT